jgi:AcrR family transcriptional regulator
VEVDMRYSREHSEQTRSRIIDAAARQFRSLGYHGVGVDGIANAAGVTSGAFYKHFRSKSEAFRTAAITGLEKLRAGIEHYKLSRLKDWLGSFVDFYLGPKHTSDLPGGCTLPSLTSEVVRADLETRIAYQEELLKVAAALASGIPDGQSRETTWPVLAQLLGGVMLVRVVEDKRLKREIAEAIKASIKSAVEP